MQKSYPYILIIGSIIGLLASFVLMLNTINLIKNPNIDLPCDISPFVSCTSVSNAWQSQIFGFPNPLLGIVGFSMLLAIGAMLLSGYPTSQSFEGTSRARKSFWLLVNFGSLVSMAFVVWFFYQSVYSIGSLCIYCMAIWTVTWPIFLYTTLWNFKEEHLKLSFLNFISCHHITILIVGYLIMILLILSHFRDFFFY